MKKTNENWLTKILYWNLFAKANWNFRYIQRVSLATFLLLEQSMKFTVNFVSKATLTRFFLVHMLIDSLTQQWQGQKHEQPCIVNHKKFCPIHHVLK